MKNSEIENKLGLIQNRQYSLEAFDSELQRIKEVYVKEEKQIEAK